MFLYLGSVKHSVIGCLACQSHFKHVFVLAAGSLADNGALKVNAHLQVQGFSNVFAVGDCADVNEPKMAYHAGLHAGVAVTNIANSLSGKELTSYRTGTHTPVLSVSG